MPREEALWQHKQRLQMPHARRLLVGSCSNRGLDRRDRTFVSYRMCPPTEPWWQDAWKLVRDNLKGDSTSERDDAALARVVAARGDHVALEREDEVVRRRHRRERLLALVGIADDVLEVDPLGGERLGHA